MYMMVARVPARAPRPTAITKITAHNNEGRVRIIARRKRTGMVVWALKRFREARRPRGREMMVPKRVPMKAISRVSSIAMRAVFIRELSGGKASSKRVAKFGRPWRSFPGSRPK